MSIQFSNETAAAKFITMAEDVASIKTTLQDLPELKKKIEKHERAYNVGKWAAVPLFGVVNIALKHVWTKLGM